MAHWATSRAGQEGFDGAFNVVSFKDAVELRRLLPSLKVKSLPILHDLTSRPANPSITRTDRGMWGIVRLLNYEVNYDANGWTYYTFLERLPRRRTPLLRSRNLLLRLNEFGGIVHGAEISLPVDWPDPKYPKILGLEDSRLFEWQGCLWVIATIKEMHEDGIGRMILARIDGAGTDNPRFADWRMVDPGGPLRDQKNWMPLVDGDALRFVFTLDPMRLIDEQGRTLKTWPQRHGAGCVMRGGSQFIPFQGGWLGLEHEQIIERSRRDGTLYYYHRFVWLDQDYVIRRLSPRFYFLRTSVEFAAGLCLDRNGRTLRLSFGVDDRKAYLAKLQIDELDAALSEASPIFDGSIPFGATDDS